MALIAKDLAQAMFDTLGNKIDKDGNTIDIPQHLIDRAEGLIAAIKAGSVTHAANSVTATGAPGSPITLGAATGGTISGMDASKMSAKSAQSSPGPGTSPENEALITYISTGLINFLPGSITGTCTATTEAPGVLLNGAGTKGRITGITGAGAVAATGSSGPEALNHYTAIINYLLSNLEVEYSTGSVTGAFASGGGAMTNGAATGGKLK